MKFFLIVYSQLLCLNVVTNSAPNCQYVDGTAFSLAVTNSPYCKCTELELPYLNVDGLSCVKYCQVDYSNPSVNYYTCSSTSLGISMCSGTNLDGSNGLSCELVTNNVNCQTYDSTQNRCYLCKTGNYLYAGACLPCINSCKYCVNSTTCIECEPAYGNNQDRKCEDCVQNCSNCDGGQCNECKSGYFLSGLNCAMCPDNCSVCDNEVSCLTCETGYGLTADDLTCQICSSNCVTCVLNGAGKCDQCIHAYGLTTDNTCGVCADNCEICDITGAGNCDICEYGYGLTTTGDCDLCDSNAVDNVGQFTQMGCLACTFSGAGQCDVCNSSIGYYLVSPQMTCNLCPSNQSWSPTNMNCTSLCLPGFAVDTGTCGSCSTNCTTCSTVATCDVCNTGYRLNSSTNLCEMCDANCTTCAINGAGKCDSQYYCAIDYTFNNTTLNCDLQCPSINECAICNLDALNVMVCNKCNSGYWLNTDANQCELCSATLLNCAECSNSIDQCSTCIDNYSVNKVSLGLANYYGTAMQPCIQCAPNCQDCTISGYMACDMCNPGYQLIQGKITSLCVLKNEINNCQSIYSINNVTKCSKCYDDSSITIDGLNCVYNKFKFCSIYYNDQLNCMSCVDGYSLSITQDFPVFPNGTSCLPGCNNSTLNPNSCEQQLIKYVGDTYNVDIIPKINSALNLYVQFHIYDIVSLNQNKGVFKVIFMPIFYWYDSRLTWEPSMWRNVDYLVVPSDMIWHPDVMILNTYGGNNLYGSTNEAWLYAGTNKEWWYNVRWSPQGYYEVAHTYTLDKFPYDNEDLEIILQSNLINNESLVLNMVNTIDADIANVTASSNIESVNSYYVYKGHSSSVDTMYYNGEGFSTLTLNLKIKMAISYSDTLMFFPILSLLLIIICNNCLTNDKLMKIQYSFKVLFIMVIIVQAVYNFLPKIKYQITLELTYFYVFVIIAFSILINILEDIIMSRLVENKKGELLKEIDRDEEFDKNEFELNLKVQTGSSDKEKEKEKEQGEKGEKGEKEKDAGIRIDNGYRPIHFFGNCLYYINSVMILFTIIAVVYSYLYLKNQNETWYKNNLSSNLPIEG